MLRPPFAMCECPVMVIIVIIGIVPAWVCQWRHNDSLITEVLRSQLQIDQSQRVLKLKLGFDRRWWRGSENLREFYPVILENTIDLVGFMGLFEMYHFWESIFLQTSFFYGIPKHRETKILRNRFSNRDQNTGSHRFPNPGSHH